MFIGIDVGGTHTDAVAIDRNGRTVAVAKIVTNHNDLLDSICSAMDGVFADIDERLVERINLSTTLSTNILIEGRTEDVGVIVSSGPGMDPANYKVGCFHWVPGSIDHRGRETSPLDLRAMDAAIKNCRHHGIKVFAVVGKFSTRNQAHELLMAETLSSRTCLESVPDFISAGHRLSGLLNFPRRIFTSYYNAATWRTYNTFANAIERSLGKRNGPLRHKVNILKADAGTMPFPASRHLPVETIASGPAASIMGVMAMAVGHADCLIFDIGGTTTDISVLLNGLPVQEEEGIVLNHLPTLVRGLKTVSIGVGGDSAIRVEAGTVLAGPQRLGPAMAMGGDFPTLTDAMNILGLCRVGDLNRSREGLEDLALKHGLSARSLAERALAHGVAAIKEASERLLREINEKPLYTIMEMLTNRQSRVSEIVLIGGPAKAFQKPLAAAFDLPVHVPGDYSVGSALGAALARSTMSAELFADTAKGLMIIPNLGITEPVGSAYSLEQAEAELRRHLLAYMRDMGVAEDSQRDFIITEKDSFAIIEGSRRSGRSIRVKCQIKPGVSRF